jgi:hypothetical protein
MPPSNHHGDSAVYIAVVYGDSDDSSMKQPLLLAHDEVNNNNKEHTVDDEVVGPVMKDAGTQTVVVVHHPSFPCAMGLGATVGFFIQVISLGAYGVMLMYWGEDALHTSKTKIDWLLYGILALLTQIDLCIYVAIWLAFTCTMTRTGMDMLRNRLFACSVRASYHELSSAPTTTTTTTTTTSSSEELQKTVRRRFVFIVGVYFLVGIVLGAFCAWTVIDFYLGFPIPFLPILVTVVVDLILCYLMVWCYDLGKDETIDEDDPVEGC